MFARKTPSPAQRAGHSVHTPSTAADATRPRGHAAHGNQELQQGCYRSPTGIGWRVGGRPDRAEFEADTVAARVASTSASGSAASRQTIPFRPAALPFRSAGERLDGAAQSRLAPHFAGLDQVRIHASAEGADAAAALRADAFAVGADIAFAAGRYAPARHRASACWPTSWRISRRAAT